MKYEISDTYSNIPDNFEPFCSNVLNIPFRQFIETIFFIIRNYIPLSQCRNAV